MKPSPIFKSHDVVIVISHVPKHIAAKAKQSKLGNFFSNLPGSTTAGVPPKNAPSKLVASSQEELTGAVPASTKSSIPRRAAAVLAATKLVSAKESSSEENDDEEEDEVIQISSGSEKASPVVRHFRECIYWCCLMLRQNVLKL